MKKMFLSTQQLVDQLKMYSEADKAAGNSERAYALDFAIKLIEEYHPDLQPKCEVLGCKNLAEYEGWYRCRDPLLGTPTGLTQRRQVCEEHTVLLIGKEKE